MKTTLTSVLAHPHFRHVLVIINCFLISLVILTILKIGPAENYDVSFISAYPFYLWISLYAVYVLGVILSLIDIGVCRKSFSLGLAFLIISNCLFLLIPYFRGYYAVDVHDSTTLLGYIRDLSADGHLNPADFYPIYHLIFFFSATVTSLNFNLISLISPAIIYVFLIFSMVALSRAFKFNSWVTLLVLIAASPLVYPEILVSIPRTFLISFLPLFLYSLWRVFNLKKTRELIILVLFIFILTLTHPLNGGPLLFIPFSIAIILFSAKRVNGTNMRAALGTSIKPVFFSLCAWLVLWFTWNLGFQPMKVLIRQLASDLTGISNLTQFTGLVTSSNLPFYYVIQIFLKEFLAEIIYVLIGFLFTVTIVYRFIRKREMSVNLFFALSFLAFSCWLIIGIIMPNNLTFYRFMPYLIISSVFLMATSIGFKRKKAAILLVVLVCFVQALGMANTYSSQWTATINSSLAYSQVSGVYWFSVNEINSIPVKQVWFETYSPLVALQGYYFPTKNVVTNEVPPEHLQYELPENSSGLYVFIPTYAYSWYQTKFPEFESAWRYTSDDTYGLFNDSRVHVVYSNPTLQLLKIEP
jgi:hypothetical protein